MPPSSPPPLSPMGQAALQLSRRGWPVFPCRERDESFLNSAKKPITFNAKAPYGGQGLKDATRDEARITAWWRDHPEAMIGLPMGVNGCFVVDFDPRTEEVFDEATGEVAIDPETGKPQLREWTLEQMKAELEALMGVPLPPSLTSRTPSGGVHVWFRQPSDGGAPIRNSVGGKRLTDHIDVRGEGGYVVGPPSRCLGGAKASEGEYRWIGRLGDWRDDSAIAEAPRELIELLRAPRKREEAPAAPPRPSGAGRSNVAADVDEDLRKYALSALSGECAEIRKAGTGKRNDQLNVSALKIASLVAAGVLDETIARTSIEAAAGDNPGNDDDRQLLATINSGWTAGLSSPRDLGEIAAAARSRRERGNRPSRGPSRPPARGAPPVDARKEPFRDGRADGVSELGGEDAARLKAVAEAWFERRCAYADETKEAVTRLAFSAGRRIAAGLLAEATVKEKLWELYGEKIADVQHSDVDRAIGDGINRGFDLTPQLTMLKCVRYPLTDFGIGERFRDRYGEDFRFTTAKGWLGWDGRRWKMLDQDEKTPPPEVIAAVMETIRAIQDEARFIADTGVKLPLIEDDPKKPRLALEEDRNAHALDYWVPVGRTFKLHSTLVAAWGRSAETTDKPAAVAKLARRWLSLSIDAFDNDPFAVNVLNGTLRFARETLPDGSRSASVVLEPHRREQLNTKLAAIEYDPQAKCPLYDGMFEWAQPRSPMRRYLHQLGGYGLTGDAGEQKLWFWYGRGRNGKGVTIETWCYVAGDYSDSIPIESFLDQGIKKRGDAASPDLAKLGGVRMLRASEPGKNEKLNTALIKFVTGGEPVPVRMLHRGFFNLVPNFKLIISGNSKFDIPDTDDGIWGRLKLVPWLRNIDKPEPGVENWPVKDLELAAKIKATEGAGVFNHLVRGLLDYLANGFVEPSDVTEATSDYRDGSDPLGRFLRLCTEADPDGRIQSSKLHAVFIAWGRAAGEFSREWSNKGLSKAMEEKGFKKIASDGMHWLGLRLTKQVSDFETEDGKVRDLDLVEGAERARAPPRDDDGPIPGFEDIPP